MKRYKLTITLKSDLLCGSGEGLSSAIDIDLCYDSQGLPYIPARRIKGCLRKAARLVATEGDTKLINLIFGVQGNDVPGLITVGDATLDTSNLQLPQDPTEVLDQLTYIRTQNKINYSTGTVESNTLRSLRVVRHYVPLANQPGRFRETRLEADVYVADCGQAVAVEEFLKSKAVPALRNIGMGRNRGLGAVKCKLTDGTQPNKGVNHDNIFRQLFEDPTNGEMVALSYAVRLDSPLMLPQQNGTKSTWYVSGTAVQGFFASRLAYRDDFDDLFFGGKVRFSPLFPLELGNDGIGIEGRSVPAPAFISKLKGGDHDGRYVCTAMHHCMEGESLKPLKEGFVSEHSWLPVEQEVEVVYHHSTGKDSTLYMQQCLSSGQLLGGFIECTPEYENVIQEVLAMGTLSFGRSKSAQYARCSVVTCEQDFSHRSEDVNVSLQCAFRYAYLLESNVALIDEGLAAHSSSIGLLKREIAKSANVSFAPDTNVGTSISTLEVGGYNAKWNQKKPHMTVFAAGGAIVLVSKGSVPRIITIGERQGEGYGRLRLVCMRLGEAMPPLFEEQEAYEQAALHDASCAPTFEEHCRILTLDYCDSANARECLRSLSRSFIGRLSLMVRQSSSYEDLLCRVERVRDVAKRDATERLLQGLGVELETQEGGTLTWPLRQECIAMMLRFAKYQKKYAPEDGDSQ